MLLLLLLAAAAAGCMLLLLLLASAMAGGMLLLAAAAAAGACCCCFDVFCCCFVLFCLIPLIANKAKNGSKIFKIEDDYTTLFGYSVNQLGPLKSRKRHTENSIQSSIAHSGPVQQEAGSFHN